MNYEKIIKELDEMIAELDKKAAPRDEHEDRFEDMEREAADMAKAVRLTYEAFIDEGFTESQAMKLTAILIQHNL